MRSATLLLCTIVLAGCAESPSGDTTSPSTVSVFAPETISLPDSNIFRGSFSPDGTEFYFFRKIQPGTEDYRIFVSRYDGTNWSAGERVNLGGEYSDMYPSVSPDNRLLVFSSYRPAPGDTAAHENANLWLSQRTDDGWSAPSLLEGPSTFANYDAGPRFGTDGNIYFNSIEPGWRVRHARMSVQQPDGSFGMHAQDTTFNRWADFREDVFVWTGTMSPDSMFVLLDVSEVDSNGRTLPTDQWYSVRSGDSWTEPQKIGGGFNTDADYENFVTLSPDGKTIYFARGFRQYWRVSTDAVLKGTDEE